MYSFFKRIFKRKQYIEVEDVMKKYLIVGLGNFGEKYKNRF